MARVIDHAPIVGTVALAVYSQLIMRWQVSRSGPMPDDLAAQFAHVIGLLLSPWVMSGIVAAFLSGVAWLVAMSRFEISYAYPFVALSYVLVLAAGYLLFQESVSMAKLGGSILVILGIVVIARG